MLHRPLRGAIALSLGALFAFAGTAAADTARADGDGDTTMIDPVALLDGPVAPGELVSVDIGLVLTCTGSTHLDPGQVVTASIDSAVAPEDGVIVSVTDATLGVPEEGWPIDGAPCPIPAPTYRGGTPSVVTFTAPTRPAIGHRFSLMYHRSISPFGNDDANALRQATAIDILVDVVGNTPPSVVLPTVAAMGTVEGNTTGGWTADWSGLGATDREDDPDPTASCDPAAGTVLNLGPTPVTCRVTDGGGLPASRGFTLTVVDETAPTLTGVPGDRHVTTSDPTGTTITYPVPGATDVVDDAPTVGCLPANGFHADPGTTTTVTCTATDDSGNPAEASFDVTVEYVAPHAAGATWGEPIAGSGTIFSANRGRNVPVKVTLSVDGVVRTSGNAVLVVTPCDGGSAVTLPLTFGGGRWNVGLDTAALVGSCHTVTARIDGLDAGSFQLHLRGAEPAKASRPAPTTVSPPTPTPVAKTKPAAKPLKPVASKPAKAKPVTKAVKPAAIKPAEKPAKTTGMK